MNEKVRPAQRASKSSPVPATDPDLPSTGRRMTRDAAAALSESMKPLVSRMRAAHAIDTAAAFLLDDAPLDHARKESTEYLMALAAHAVRVAADHGGDEGAESLRELDDVIRRVLDRHHQPTSRPVTVSDDEGSAPLTYTAEPSRVLRSPKAAKLLVGVINDALPWLAKIAAESGGVLDATRGVLQEGIPQEVLAVLCRHPEHFPGGASVESLAEVIASAAMKSKGADYVASKVLSAWGMSPEAAKAIVRPTKTRRPAKNRKS